VRGGNFDENLVYVNGIEVYRPVLTRAGQQEGLSFVNVDMTEDVYFSTGGFEAKYGDKMSSVLDITYREPTKFRATFSASLLGVMAEVEDTVKGGRFSWQLGIRNKTNKYLLRSLDTKGDYTANFTDVQTSLIWHLSDVCYINYIGNYATNKYNLVPSTRETDFGTLNNALRFTVYFDGQELNRFNTIFNAVSLNYDHPRWQTKFIFSSFNTYESETYDVQGQYYIDQLEADFGKPTFGQVAFNRGVGTFINHGRNYLDAWVNSAEFKATHSHKDLTWNFGVRVQDERIQDKLSEWNYVDSAGYSIPYQPYNSLDLQDVIKANDQLSSQRAMGFAQVRWIKILKDTSDLSITFGVRGNYWTLNGQFIAEPRLQVEYKPHHHQNITYRLATGLYDQPPFYKELRDFSGTVHTDVRAQTSVHAIAGADVTFKMWGRPFRFITEGYYKYLDNLVPYEVNDVRIRYYGANLSHGYAYGTDLRMNGEFVKGVDSWVNLSLLRTKEDLYNDNYYLYLNSDGDTIIPGYTFNNVKTDSILQKPGYVPRPTDQLLTFALYFQDYLPKIPSCKMNLGLILGSGLPFGPPTHERYKAVFRMPPYRRVDIGFSYEFIKEDKPLDPSNPFHAFKSLWVGAEVYNLLQVQNTISYYWVKDVTGRSYAIPNYLTNRQISVRLIARF
ncbi:MAG TPA: TonB-dependent receptor, partial [Bacteroidia bacterium]|nr:TonB-dependent receptor [Bacteroidia bacterium]